MAIYAVDSTPLPGFVFVASADVLEYFPPNFALSKEQLSTDFLLIAHQSPMEIATQHGVYLLDGEGRFKL